MRIIRYQYKTEATTYGWLLENKVGPIVGNIYGEYRRQEVALPLESVRLLAPVQLCSGCARPEEQPLLGGVEQSAQGLALCYCQLQVGRMTHRLGQQITGCIEPSPRQRELGPEVADDCQQAAVTGRLAQPCSFAQDLISLTEVAAAEVSPAQTDKSLAVQTSGSLVFPLGFEHGAEHERGVAILGPFE